jgi:hypothetical protein
MQFAQEEDGVVCEYGISHQQKEITLLRIGPGVHVREAYELQNINNTAREITRAAFEMMI